MTMDGNCDNDLPSRREMLRRAGGGFGSLALAALLADEAAAARRPPIRSRPGRRSCRPGPGG